MSVPDSGPQRLPPVPQTIARDPSEGSLAQTEALFDAVLRQTLAAASAEEPLDDSTRVALDEVARRWRGRPLALDPIVIGLVEAVLVGQFPKRIGAAEFRGRVARNIAQTLFADPGSHARLETLWTRLGGTLS